MWIQRAHKSFTNYALKWIENPLFMVVTGSRMFGFHDEDSDWDVYCVHAIPSVEFFTITKPETGFVTPEAKIYNKKVSVKVEDVEHMFRRIMDGDMKTIERIFSPEVILKTEHLHSIRSISKQFINQDTLESYLQHVDKFLCLYDETNNIKYLLYALRTALTANLMVRTNLFVVRLGDLNAHYPQSNLLSLARAKQQHLLLDDTNVIETTMHEIEASTRQTAELLPKFRPNRRQLRTKVGDLNRYLVSLRLQHMYSPKMEIKFKDL